MKIYPSGDITSGLIKNDKIVNVKLISNQNAVIGGLLFMKQAFELIDNKIKFIVKKKDGSQVKKGSLIATIKGKAKNILIAERVGLNFLSHISGIATKTNKIKPQLYLSIIPKRDAVLFLLLFPTNAEHQPFLQL